MAKETSFDEVHDAQSQFRVLLDAMARPGKINYLKDLPISVPEGLNKSSGIIAFSLLNTDTHFFVAQRAQSETIIDYIYLNTHAAIGSVDTADYVFIDGQENAELLHHTKTGSLNYPEDSASIIIDVIEISPTHQNASLQIKLKGPGIETEKTVFVKGINKEILEIAQEQNSEFPKGIDLIITDKKNAILCIPRSNQFEIIQN